MIIVLTGNNQILKNKEMESLLAKEGGSDSFLMLSFDDNQPVTLLEEMIRSEDIFGKPVLLKIVASDSKVYFDVFKNTLSRFDKSKDICVVFTPSLTKPERIFFEKANATIKDFTFTKAKESPLVFALTDALIKKDKKNAWIIFQRMIDTNTAPEEIHGALWWQWKTLSLVVSKEKNIAKKNISPYVFSKSEAASKKIGEKEIQNGLSMLMKMFQNSRRGTSDLIHQIELFILTQ